MYESNYRKVSPLKRFFNGVKRPLAWPFGRGTAKSFFRMYLLLIFLGTLMLYTPLAQSSAAREGASGLFSYVKTSDGTPFTFMDALFTAASAFSDTGLVVTNTYSQFTMFGHVIILILIILGGIGVMAIKVMFLIFIGKKIGLKEKMLIQSERGSSKIGGTYDLIVTATQVIFIFILLGIVLLTPYFFFVEQSGFGAENVPSGNFFASLWHAIFHSISAINNAGFDITGSASIAPYANDLYVQVIFIFLLVSGGIGFPVFYDIKRKIRMKKTGSKAKFKWSLFTKLTIVTYIIIVVIGLSISFYFEINSADPGSLWNLAKAGKASTDGVVYSQVEVIQGIIFSTFSTRNAGFATIPMYEFQTTTKILWSFMMWIGSSPASTAGGLRTTTVAIVCLAIAASARGKDRVFVFKRRIPSDVTRRALVATVTSLMIISIGTIILVPSVEAAVRAGSTTNIGAWDAFFEVSSAFGTTGLSTGVTPLLAPGAQITIIVIMIIGQLGLSATMDILSSANHEENKIIYAEEDVIIG